MSKIVWNLTKCKQYGKYADVDLTTIAIDSAVRCFVFPDNGFFTKSGNGSATVNGQEVALSKNVLGTGYFSLYLKRISETQIQVGTSSSNLFDIVDLEIIVNATCAQDLSEIPITPELNLQNCSLAPFSQSAAYDGGLLFIVPQVGFDFENLPIAIRNGSIQINGTIFQASNFDETVVQISIGTPLASLSVTGEAVRSAPITEIQITNELENASVNSLILDLTTTNNFVINANDGYEFDTPPYIEIVFENNVTSLPFVAVDNSYALTIDGTQYQNAISAVFKGGAKKVSQRLSIVIDSEFAEFTKNSATEINESDTVYYVEIRAKGGYMFSKPPTLTCYFAGLDAGQRRTVTMSQVSGKLNTYYYEISIGQYGDNDPQHFFEQNQGKGTPSITSNIVVETTLLSDFGVVRVHKTNKVLNQDLFNKRFYDTGNNEFEDLGKYIISFVRYPFDVPTLGEMSVMFGWFDSEIVTPLVENGVYSFSLGKKLVSGLYGNSSDIDNVTITLVIPYVGIVSLDSRYVNTEIEIIYRVDILTNSAVVEIYSDNSLVDTMETQVGYDIPFILKTDEITPNIKLTSNLIKNYNPKVILRQKGRVEGIPYKTSTMRKLSELSGDVKCGIVHLAISEQMTITEQKEIVQLLQSGVQF